MFFVFLGNAIFQGIGDTRTPMKVGAVVMILNIVLDPIMIFGFWFFPRLEAPGAALATVLSRSIGSVIILYLLLRGNHAVRINLKYMKLDFDIIKKIFVIGIPGSIQMLLRSFSAVILMKIASLFGTYVVAAYGVGARLFHLFLFPGFSLGGAVATLVGQNLGAKNFHRAQKSAYLASFYYLMFLIVAVIFIFIFAPQVASLFNKETEFVNTASVYFRYLAVGALFLSSGVIFSRALQGASDTVSPMIITALSLYVMHIPIAYLLATHFSFKENGIWIATVIGNLTNGVLMAIVFFKGKWKYKRIEYLHKVSESITQSEPVLRS